MDSPESQRYEQIRLLEDRNQIPTEIVRQGPAGSIDVIDVAGSAQCGEAWSPIFTKQRPPCLVRVLLLDPDGVAVRRRASESDYWKGDHERVRAKIRRNSLRLHDIGRRGSFALTLRYYDELPVSRYVRADEAIFQSYYPTDRSGRHVPVAVLSAGTMLGQRAIREFHVLWHTRSRLFEPEAQVSHG